MILTVTLNPLLERRLFFSNIKLGSENRTAVEKYTAGGKGINVSRQLNFLGINNLAVTFLGGNNGRIIKNILSEEKINFTSIQTKSETRSAALIVEEESYKVTTFFGPNSRVLEAEVTEFKLKLRKMIENCEIVVFSGSSPYPETDDIFPFGIEVANEYDKVSICDTYGTHLENCINKSPTILHNNFTETSKSLGYNLSSEDSIINYLQQLYQKGVKQAFLTNGAESVYAKNFDFMYKVEPPSIDEVDPTGSGDAFTAGLAYGIHNSLTFEETLIISVSLGAANASRSAVCNMSFDDLIMFKDKIAVETIGKKIKQE